MYRRRLSGRGPTLAIALIALFVALGGTAYASGLISGKQIENHTIAEKKLTGPAIKALRGHRGPRGQKGPAGPITGTLPHGVTVRGFYSITANAPASTTQYTTQPISFGLQLASAPTVHVIQSGSQAPAGCSGNYVNPGADSGNLCIFVYEMYGSALYEENPLTSVQSQATTFGGELTLFSNSTGGAYWAYGTWAVSG